MAKKKEDGEQKKSSIVTLVKEHRFSGKIVEDRKREIIKISPSIDFVFSGGLESASFCIICGKPKIGKTTTCLHMAKKAQQAGYCVVYLNIEARLTARDLKSCHGLDIEDPEKFCFYESTKERILSGQDFIGIADHILSTRDKVFLVFDSLSQLISSESLNSDVRDQNRENISIILSKFFKRIAPHLNMRNNIIVGITHYVANVSGYGSTKSETSGNKAQYMQNFKLEGGKTEGWIGDDGKTQIGQTIEWKCINSALGAPNKTAKGYLRYNYGLDEEYELLLSADSLGVVQKSGNWFIFNEENKVNGLSKAVEFLRDNKELAQKIREGVDDRLGC